MITILDDLYLAVFQLMLTLAGKKKWTCELYLPWCWISRTTLLVLTFGWLQLRLAIHPDDANIQVLAAVVVTHRMPLSIRGLARLIARMMAWLAYIELDQPAGRLDVIKPWPAAAVSAARP